MLEIAIKIPCRAQVTQTVGTFHIHLNPLLYRGLHCGFFGGAVNLRQSQYQTMNAFGHLFQNLKFPRYDVNWQYSDSLFS